MPPPRTTARRLLCALLPALLLAACAGQPTSRVPVMRGDGIRPLLDGATYDGPLLVEVLDYAYGAGASAPIIGTAVEDGIDYRRVRVVTDPALRPDPAYRLRVALDPPARATPQRLCAWTPPDAPPSEQAAGPLAVVMVFCTGDAMEATVLGTVARPDSPTSPGLAALVRQMTRQLVAPRPDHGLPAWRLG